MTENDFVDDFKDVRTEFIERVALLFGIDLSKHELIKSLALNVMYAGIVRYTLKIYISVQNLILLFTKSVY